MDLEMKLSSYFFKIHTAEAPTRAGELACEARLRGKPVRQPHARAELCRHREGILMIL